MLGFTGLRALAAAVTPLFHAEAYYWTWSRHLAWGYWDHPPGVAVVLRLFSWILPQSEIGLRLGHILLSSLGSWVFYLLCLRLVSSRAALASLLVLSFAPFWLPWGVVATPDGPMMFMWVVSLYLFHRAQAGEGLGMWLATGLAVGAATLSKYNGFLLVPSLFAWLLLSARGRRMLLTPGPWLAALVAGALIAPNLLIDFGHGEVTLTTPVGTAEEREYGKWALHLLMWMVLPFGLLTPLVAVAWFERTRVGLTTGRLWRDSKFQFLFCTAWLPFLAFAGVAVMTEVHFHWPAPAMVMALPLAFETLGAIGPHQPSRRFLRLAVVSGAAIMGAVGLLGLATMFVPPMIGTGIWRKPLELTVQVRGWDELQARLEHELAERGRTRPVFVASSSYRLASHAVYLTGGRYPGVSFNLERSHQFLYWRNDLDLIGDDGLYVESDVSEGDMDGLRRSCSGIEPLEPVTMRVNGQDVPRFQLFWCHGFTGLGP